VPGAPAPALDAVARVQPLSRWPFGRLEASTRGLDLAALASRAPHARLSGRAVMAPREPDRPLSVTLELDNALAGRLDEQRVPVRRLRATLQAPSVQLERLDAGVLEVVFGTAAGEAGRLQSSGAWQGSTLTLDSARDRSAPAARGPARPGAAGFRPAEDGLVGPAAAARRARGAPDPRGSGRGVQRRAARRAGGAAAARQPGLRGPCRCEAVRAHAAARRLGHGEADLGLRLAPAAEGRGWQARSEGRLAGFDPLARFPGPEGSAWRRGPHRFNAGWNLALSVPAEALALPPLLLLQRLQGQGTLDFNDSQIAGVPLEGALQLAQ
jgi:translocation and assembly module TamB